MGSLEEEKLIQMVQDFMESESPTPISTSSDDSSFGNQSAYRTLQEILGSVTDGERVVLELVLRYLTNVRFERKLECVKKWLVTRLGMDGYDASLCKTKTSWITTENFCGGDYEYIDIMMRDEEGGSIRLIVDIDFKSQFELARPTPTYKHILKPLPSIFVGNEEKLLKMVSLLCSAAKQSLKENGLHIPPWRKTSYMQSKWISHYQREQISTTAIKEVGGEAADECGPSSTFSKWSPPMIKIDPKSRDWGSGSALTSQISNMGINCC